MDMEERTLTVDFDGQLVEYEVSELDELTLAYATTHPQVARVRYTIVVMPVLMTTM
jgi:exodeoxyribonuclease V alpha subunit